MTGWRNLSLRSVKRPKRLTDAFYGCEKVEETFWFGDNSANFSRVKKYNDEFRGVYILTIREKTLNLISYS